MRTQPIVFWFVTLLLATGAHAQDAPDVQACAAYDAIPIPQKDAGPAMPGCNASVLYYGADGSTRGSDFTAARKCAYAQREANATDDPFGGSSMLMMIYANGRGVPRNIPLAKRFACEIDAPGYETESRIRKLDTMAKAKSTKAVFDACDDVGNDFMIGNCLWRDSKFADFKRERRIASLQSSWTAGQKQAFGALRKAAEDYFAASSDGEVTHQGTMSVIFLNGHSEKLKDDFVKALERFERGGQPSPGADAYSAEDAKLNTTYKGWIRKLALDEKHGESGVADVHAQGVQDAQRKWLVYREAWVAFAAARYPSVPAGAWRAWLSHERIATLKESATAEY